MEDMAVCSVMSNLQNIDKIDCLSNTSAQFLSLQCLPYIKTCFLCVFPVSPKHQNHTFCASFQCLQTSKTHLVHHSLVSPEPPKHTIYISPMSPKHLNTPYTPLSHISQTSKHTCTALFSLSQTSKHTLYISLP